MADESLVELVERLGPTAEHNPEARRQAVQRIVELSDGGLTRLGAEDMLAKHRTLRATLEEIRRDACALLDRIYGL